MPTRRSGRVSSLALFVAIATSCLLFSAASDAKCSQSHRWPSFGPAASTGIEQFTIGKLRFAIPLNDFRERSDICDGHTTAFLLRVFYPSFEGATNDNIGRLYSAGRWRDRVQILVVEQSNGPLSGILRVWTKYWKTTRRKEQLYGMHVIDYEYVGNKWEVYFKPTFEAPLVVANVWRTGRPLHDLPGDSQIPRSAD